MSESMRELRELFQRELPDLFTRNAVMMRAETERLVIGRVEGVVAKLRDHNRKETAAEINGMLAVELAKPEYEKQKEVKEALVVLQKRVKARFGL